MPNEEIKALAKSNKVKLWEIAEKLNILDCNFSRKLRHELSAEEKKKIVQIIGEIKKDRLWSANLQADKAN